MKASLVRVGATVLDGYRLYWGTALLLMAVSALALAAILPVLSLALPDGTAHLFFASVRGSDLGLAWSASPRSPAAAQAETVAILSALLFAAAVTVVITAAITGAVLAHARASTRAGDLIIRRAVGASGRALFAAGVVEVAGLALGAIIVGSAVGLLVSRWATGTWPGASEPELMPALGIGAVSALVILLPVLPGRRWRRQPLTDADPRPLVIFVPVFVQIMVSFILLVLSGLLSRPPGAEHQVAPPLASDAVYQLESDGSPRQLSTAYGELLVGLAARPGVSSVSLSSPGSVLGMGTVAKITTDCGECSDGGLPIRWRRPSVTHQFVSADTFRTLGIKVLAGRAITNADTWDAPRVAVVSETLAAQHFEFGEAIGREVRVGVGGDEWYTVVGVVRDPPARGFGASIQPPYTVYLSILQHPSRSADLIIEGGTEGSASIAPWIRTVARKMATVTEVKPVAASALVAAERAPTRWFGRWLGSSALALMAIATIGLFAFLRLWVESLRPELGLRRAVGALRWQVVGRTVASAASLALVALLLGLWFGPGVWTGVRSLLRRIPDWRVADLGAPALGLLAVAALGAAWPAWRASREPPAVLLAPPEG